MIEGKWKIDRSYKNICIEMLTENLASLRAKADITQGEISNLIGISRQTYYAIETGQRTMSWNTYLSLLLFFDTNNYFQRYSACQNWLGTHCIKHTNSIGCLLCFLGFLCPGGICHQKSLQCT